MHKNSAIADKTPSDGLGMLVGKQIQGDLFARYNYNIIRVWT